VAHGAEDGGHEERHGVHGRETAQGGEGHERRVAVAHGAADVFRLEALDAAAVAQVVGDAGGGERALGGGEESGRGGAVGEEEVGGEAEDDGEETLEEEDVAPGVEGAPGGDFGEGAGEEAAERAAVLGRVLSGWLVNRGGCGMRMFVHESFFRRRNVPEGSHTSV